MRAKAEPTNCKSCDEAKSEKLPLSADGQWRSLSHKKEGASGAVGKEDAPCHIGVDLLGSDIPPLPLLKAVLSFIEELKPSIHLTLFGTHELFDGIPSPGANILFHGVHETITMDDAPLTAVRHKRNSSLCSGIRLLKEGHLQAFISAGNTGALMACAKIELSGISPVLRPALMALIPASHSDIAVLDVGANTSYKAEHLVQFAAMGVAYQKSRGIKKPRVGLLNIGSEAKKGTPELQTAYNALLSQSQKKNGSFSFSGNIEGRDVFQGEIDVLVTDGFTGNVFLKTAEGIAAVIMEELQGPSINGCPPHIKEILSKTHQKLNYAEYPGAILCGIDGIVMKCHGNSSPKSILSSISTAARLVRHGFLDTIKKELQLF